jgi:hypothetical protein
LTRAQRSLIFLASGTSYSKGKFRTAVPTTLIDAKSPNELGQHVSALTYWVTNPSSKPCSPFSRASTSKSMEKWSHGRPIGTSSFAIAKAGKSASACKPSIVSCWAATGWSIATLSSISNSRQFRSFLM